MKLITCEIFAADFKHLLPPDIEMHVLDIALHVNPENLHKKLQELVSRIDQGCKHIILGYGLCSCSVEGLVSDLASLVIPRMDDCTGIMLGSRDEYLRQQKTTPGTYYLSQGWINSGTHIFSEYKGMVERFGRERADRLMNSMIRHYTRLAYITADYAPDDRDNKHYCRLTADRFGLEFQELPGSSHLLKKIIARQWDQDFVVFAPGEPVDRWRFFPDPPGEPQGGATAAHAARQPALAGSVSNPPQRNRIKQGVSDDG
jgi:hypothetical protein